MIDLMRENQFEKYIKYNKNYKSYMKKKMDKNTREDWLWDKQRDGGSTWEWMLKSLTTWKYFRE